MSRGYVLGMTIERWLFICDAFLVQHPFAAGITLAGFTAVSVNNKWEPAFIDSSAGAIHKVNILAFRSMPIC